MPDCPANSPGENDRENHRENDRESAGLTGRAVAVRRVRVLLPLPLPEPLDYRLPDGAALPEPGSFARVTLGPRRLVGVVSGNDDHRISPLNLHGSHNLAGKADNFHETPFAQLTGHRPEYTRAARVPVLIDELSA